MKQSDVWVFDGFNARIFFSATGSSSSSSSGGGGTPYWFTVPDDYEQPISHIVLMIILVISAVVGTAATIYWSMSNCKNSPFFTFRDKKKNKSEEKTFFNADNA